MKKHKLILGSLTCIIVLLLTYVVLSFVNWGTLSFEAIRQEKPIKIGNEEILAKVKDLAVEGNKITSLSEDSRVEIAISAPQKYVSINVANITGVNGRRDCAQIFWANEGEPFDYERSVKFSLVVGNNTIEIPTKDYEKLRIDLTSLKDVSVEISGVELYDTMYMGNDLSDFWMQYIVAIFLIAVSAIFFNKHRRGIKECSLEIVEKYKIFFVERKATLCGTVILGIVIFGYEIFNFTLGGDEERELALATLGGNVYGIDVDVNIQNFFLVIGRYGNWLFRKLFMFEGIFTPTYTMIVTVLFLLLTAWTWCIIFDDLFQKRVNRILQILFCGIFMSVPYASTAFIGYSILNSSSACAMFSAALALLIVLQCCKQDNKIGFAVAAIFVSFGISVYQCHVNDFILGTCICILVWFLENQKCTIKELVNRLKIHVEVFLSGLLIYVFCDKIIVANVIEKSSYTDAFIAWGKEPIGTTIGNLLSGISNIFVSEKTPGNQYMLLGIVLYIFVLCIMCIKQKGVVRKLIAIMLGLITILAAFAVSIALGGILHWGTHMAVMLLIAFMWFFCMQYASKLKGKKIAYYLVVILTCFVLIRQVDIVNRIYYSAHIISELDMELGYEMGTAIVKEVGNAEANKPLYVVGKYRHQTPILNEVGMEGRSIFLRSHVYKVYLFNYLGFPFKVGNEKSNLMAQEIAKDMPLWPEEGCILETEDYIIVHLSDFL
ncbi:MAG: hypothetical protein E7291_03710 [Lachnospiraceae bacterium]|nr:hypothetical protein [Lachnospiraceae bacterium]